MATGFIIVTKTPLQRAAFTRAIEKCGNEDPNMTFQRPRENNSSKLHSPLTREITKTPKK